jgi:MFS family permease
MEERWEPPRAESEASRRQRRERARVSLSGIGDGFGMAVGRLLAGAICALAGLSGRLPISLALTALLLGLAAGGLTRRWGLPARWRAVWLADAWTLGLGTPLVTINAYVATQDRPLTPVEASLYLETVLGIGACAIGLVVLSHRIASGQRALRGYLLLPLVLQVTVLLPSARQSDPRSFLVALGGIYLIAGAVMTLGWALPGPARSLVALVSVLVYLVLAGVMSDGLTTLFARPSPVPSIHVLLSLASVLLLASESWTVPLRGPRHGLANRDRRLTQGDRNRSDPEASGLP